MQLRATKLAGTCDAKINEKTTIPRRQSGKMSAKVALPSPPPHAGL